MKFKEGAVSAYEATGDGYFYAIDPMGTSSWRLDVFLGNTRNISTLNTEYLASLELAQTTAREFDKIGPIVNRMAIAKDRAADLCALQWVKMIGLGDRIYRCAQFGGIDYFIERLATGSWLLRICMPDRTVINSTVGSKKAAKAVTGAFARSYACTHSMGDEAWRQFKNIQRRVLTRFEDPKVARDKAKNVHLTDLDAISEELDHWNEVVEANIDGWNGVGSPPPTEAAAIIKAIGQARMAIDGSGGPSNAGCKHG